MMSIKTRQKQKRTDIQALRAIAVLAVVIYHIWPERLIGGFMGVDIFFVISGYLMTLTLMRDVEPVLKSRDRLRQTGQFLTSFYARRIKRLVPAASVTLLGTLGLVVLTGSYVTIIDTTRQIISSALFYQNWLLAADSVDYLASTAAPTAVQHFWSLSVEEQFYLVWPFILLISLLLTFNIGLLYKKTRIVGAILPTILLVIGFFIYGFYLTKTDPSAAYFVTFARVWELLLGCVLAFLPRLKNHDLSLLLPWLGLAMCTYAMYSWNGDGFPGWHALVPTIGTALIIYGGTGLIESRLSFTNIFKARIIQWIGDISYSLYLWHWPFIILLPMLLAINIDSSKGSLLKFGIFIVSFVVAWLSYKFVEIPAQRVRMKKRYVFIGFVVVLAVVVGGAYFTKRTTEATVKNQLDTLHSLVKPNSGDKCIGGKWLVHQDECGNGFGKVNSSYAQFTTSDHYRQIVDGEMCGFYDYRSKKAHQFDPTYHCVVGDKSSNYQVAVYGDSHTAHWLNALNDIGIRNKIRFVTLDSRVCGSNEILLPQCKDRLEYLKNSKVLDNSRFVIVSILHRSETTLDDEFGNIEIVTKALRSVTDTPLFLLENTPPASKLIGGDCVLYNTGCRRKIAGAINDIKTVSHNVVKAGILSRNQIIPTDDMFCDDRYCYSLIGGLSVYHNAGRGKWLTNSHMTASYSLSLSLPLEAKLRKYNILPN